MTSPRTVWSALIAVAVLVLGGMIWATHTTLELEAERARSEKARREDEHRKLIASDIMLAMYRLDGIDERFREEKTHSFDVFKPWYRPPHAVDPMRGRELARPILLPSPLQELKGPDWLLLHFQASPHRWTSPQLGANDEFAVPASVFTPTDRERQATAANWFSALTSRYDPYHLQELFEQSKEACEQFGVSSGQATDIPPNKPDDTRRESSITRARSIEEFNRRGKRVLEHQSPHVHTAACERQSVILENLGVETTTTDDRSLECELVVGTQMYPVWLDLTMDGQQQLALMRTVSPANSEVCFIQGVLFDWSRLKAALEAEVEDLLPGATIEPVSPGTPLTANSLHTIPARLVAPAPPMPALASTSSGVGWGLGLAWGVCLAALAAIFYGTLKYLGLIERRMRFTAAVTHELRTPLTSFQLYTDLLTDLPDDQREQRGKYLATLRQESSRLAKLVENVLVYSKVNDAGARVALRPVAPAEILESVGAETAQQCERTGRKLVIDDKTSGGSQIETDPEFVRQILTSLIDNACKYGGKGETIWVDAFPSRGGGVTFEVDDAGPGVDPHDLREIFEPFRRGRDAERGGASGMGLGLALSRFWAACLDGRLTVRRSDRNGGHYSKFTLDLPARPRVG